MAHGSILYKLYSSDMPTSNRARLSKFADDSALLGIGEYLIASLYLQEKLLLHCLGTPAPIYEVYIPWNTSWSAPYHIVSKLVQMKLKVVQWLAETLRWT